jgi:hypothetical protein
MITDRKTAAERQCESFLSAVREFERNSNEGQFERTLSWLVAAHWARRRADLQPEGSDCGHDVYRNSPLLNEQTERGRGGVPFPRRSLD